MCMNPLTEALTVFLCAIIVAFALFAGTEAWHLKSANETIAKQQATITQLTASLEIQTANVASCKQANTENQLAIDQLTIDHAKAVNLIAQISTRKAGALVPVTAVVDKTQADPVLIEALKQVGALK